MSLWPLCALVEVNCTFGIPKEKESSFQLWLLSSGSQTGQSSLELLSKYGGLKEELKTSKEIKSHLQRIFKWIQRLAQPCRRHHQRPFFFFVWVSSSRTLVIVAPTQNWSEDAVWLALKSLAPSNVSVGLAVTKNFPLRHGLNVKQVLKMAVAWMSNWIPVCPTLA